MLLDFPTLPEALPVPLPPLPEAIKLKRQEELELEGQESGTILLAGRRSFKTVLAHLQRPHDDSHDIFKFWLEHQKGFNQQEASMLVSELDYIYRHILHELVPQIMATEESYYHFMYWCINNHRFTYKNACPTEPQVFQSIINRVVHLPIETTTANLRFCFLGRLPIDDLNYLLNIVPEHIKYIDFSYNLCSDNEDQTTTPCDLRAIADLLIATKKHIILDNLPVTKRLQRLLLNEKMLTINASINRYINDVQSGQNLHDKPPLFFRFFYGSQRYVEDVTVLIPKVLEYLRP